MLSLQYSTTVSALTAVSNHSYPVYWHCQADRVGPLDSGGLLRMGRKETLEWRAAGADIIQSSSYIIFTIH